MEGADLNLACAWALVDGLVGGGLRHACVSPGSRSTPLALALSRHPDVEVHVHLDERSSAFFAVGLARASRQPVAIACTSGTAAAEFLPAMVEASQSRVPLVALTADRPPRLRGTGANQTIQQIGLYGAYARETLDLPVPEAAGQEAWWRQAAREALEAQRTDVLGPVHINCPFEEPLSPSAGVELPSTMHEALDLPVAPSADLTPEETDRLATMVSGARGAVVVGGWPGDLTNEAMFWAQTMSWPVIAEPVSNARVPDASLLAGQSLLGSRAWVEAHRPDVVIQFGAAPTTRATQSFVASAERSIVADRWHLDSDPEHLASWRIAVDPGAVSGALRDRPVEQGEVGVAVAGPRSTDEVDELWARRLLPPPQDWLPAWRDGDRRARAALDDFLDGIGEPFEPRVARDVAASIPDGGTLVVGNSTPIRDLDLTMAPRDGLRVMANRGASGIDGLVSTSLGVAAVAPGPTVALLGDLSFLHDVGALAWASHQGTDLCIVVIANGGGELFSQLPQRDLPEHRDLFVTPHGADIGALSRAAGANHLRIERAADLVPSLLSAFGAGLQVIEVAVDAAEALVLRARSRRAVDAGLREAPDAPG